MDAIGLGGMGWLEGRRQERGAGAMVKPRPRPRPRPRTMAYAVAAMPCRTRRADHAIGWFW
ncbi:hypothetical protein [Streptomyces melanogenes]|uniref:hypothetical protein n=1 Tax=Streptomyces melanogenes TaxID=67326 RepID=UPI0037A25DFC